MRVQLWRVGEIDKAGRAVQLKDAVLHEADLDVLCRDVVVRSIVVKLCEVVEIPRCFLLLKVRASAHLIVVKIDRSAFWNIDRVVAVLVISACFVLIELR